MQSLGDDAGRASEFTEARPLAFRTGGGGEPAEAPTVARLERTSSGGRQAS